MPSAAAACAQVCRVLACWSRSPMVVQMGGRPSAAMIAALSGLPIAP